VTAEEIADFARTYLIGQPRVSGVLISPDARRAVGITADDLLVEVGP
jgi:hypothetical protein